MEEIKCPECKSANVKGLQNARRMPDHDPLKNMNRDPVRYNCKECGAEWRRSK